MSKSATITAVKSNVAVLRKCEFLGKTLSVFGTSDTPFFLAKEIASVLDLTNVSEFITRVDEDERSKFNLGRQGDAWFLTEYGLYEVLMQSRKPIAKEFKKGVKKILKDIRQQGYYAPTPQNTKLQQQIDTFIKYKGGINKVAKLSGISVATLQGVLNGTINPQNEYNGILDSFFDTRQLYQEDYQERIAANDKHITDTLYLVLRDYDEVNTLKNRVRELESELSAKKALPPVTTPAKRQGTSRKLHIVKHCEVQGSEITVFADGNNQPWFLLNRLTPWFCRENTNVMRAAYIIRYVSDANKKQFHNPTPFVGGKKAWFINSNGLNELFLHYDHQCGLNLQPYQDSINEIVKDM